MQFLTRQVQGGPETLVLTRAQVMLMQLVPDHILRREAVGCTV